MLLTTRSWLGMLVLFVLASPGEAAVQLPFVQDESTPVEVTRELDLEALAQEQAAIAAQLAEAQAALEPDALDGTQSALESSEELNLLNRLSLVIDRVLQAAPAADELRLEREQIGEELAELRTSRVASGPPLSFRALDELRDEYKLELNRTEAAATSRSTAESALSEAQRNHATRQRQLRDAKSALDAAVDAGDQSVARNSHGIAELQERITSMTVELRKLEFGECEAREQLGSSRAALLRTKIDVARELTVLRQNELDEILDDLIRETARLESELAGIRRTLPYTQSRWESASKRLASQTNPTEEERQEVASLYENKETSRYRERALSERLSRLAEQRQRWEQRILVTRDQLDDDERNELIADLGARRTSLRLETTKAEERLDPLRGQLRALKLNLEEESGAEGLVLQLKNQRRYLTQRISTYELNIASMEVLDRLIERLRVDLVGDDEDSFAATWREFKATFKMIWTYEISSLNETPITVRKLVLGLMILVIGLRLSRRFSQLVANRLLPKLGLEKTAAAVVRPLLFYFLTVTIILFALKFVDVPLTAFTVLGGALAVGIGFGSQNIVNNFISGLIILAEQPIRVGDLVQIGDLFGNVVRIGARSTQVRTGANVEIMVPNSSFLENNVVNLTLSDDKIRAFVEIGVAYGSPVREVNKLLKLAASEHGRILKNPEPFVLFESFGDNSLVFEVHFWIRSRAVMDRRIIESDLRNRIDSVFRGAHIEIAFPQHDVHLDTKTPLRVQVVEPEPVEETTG